MNFKQQCLRYYVTDAISLVIPMTEVITPEQFAMILAVLHTPLSKRPPMLCPTYLSLQQYEVLKDAACRSLTTALAGFPSKLYIDHSRLDDIVAILKRPRKRLRKRKILSSDSRISSLTVDVEAALTSSSTPTYSPSTLVYSPTAPSYSPPHSPSPTTRHFFAEKEEDDIYQQSIHHRRVMATTPLPRCILPTRANRPTDLTEPTLEFEDEVENENADVLQAVIAIDTIYGKLYASV